MAYVTKKSGGSKVAQFAASALQTLSQLPGQIQDWKLKEKEHELRLKAFESQQAQVAQEMEARKIEMTEKAYAMQGGAQWNIAASDTPKESAKAWYKRVQQFTPFTGNQMDEKTYIDQSTNTATIIGKDRAQRVLKGPSLVSRIDLSPEAHQKHYDQALADLQFASDYQDPKEIAAMRKILVDADERYQTHQSSIKQLQSKPKDTKPSLSPFQESRQREQGKAFGESEMVGGINADSMISSIDDAIKQTESYEKTSRVGTGPIAGRLTNIVPNEDLQKLDTAYKSISFDNLVKAMKGMSKLADSNTERAAYTATQPDVTKKAGVNVKVLIGQKALTVKAKAELAAQQAWLDAGNTSLDGYKSPIAGKTIAVINNDKDVQLIPSNSKDALKQAADLGYIPVDEFTKGKRGITATQQTTIMKDPNTGKRYEVDPQTKKVIREVP